MAAHGLTFWICDKNKRSRRCELVNFSKINF
jgi:hypothetical protein